MHSLEALYTVEFADMQAPGQFRNGGVVVLETNRVFGGDSGYYYVGEFQADHERISADLKIVKHNPAIPSVWLDNALEFRVRLVGKRNGQNIEAQMERLDRPGLKLPLRLTRRAELP